MEISKGFYDLSVPYQSNENDLIAILNELYEGITLLCDLNCQTLSFAQSKVSSKSLLCFAFSWLSNCGD